MDKKLDINYCNQELVLNYYEAIESLASYTMRQQSVNKIDFRRPEEDTISTN
jgi:hypothetical protein